MTQSNLEVSEPLDVSVMTPSPVSNVQDTEASPSLPSYRPTAWAAVNHVLDTIDHMSGGRAGWFQRFFTYLFIGGAASLVNLAVFYLVDYRLGLPVNGVVHNIIASVLACEISIMANFIPNDRFTFRGLPGYERSWWQRCMRFHITSLSGSILTFLIQFAFSYVGHVPPIFAQAAALILVLFYNFSFHHIFTYRRVKH